MIIKKKDHFKLPHSTANIYLNRSYTNIFITLADFKNKVIVCKSSGSCGIGRSKRRKTVPQLLRL